MALRLLTSHRIRLVAALCVLALVVTAAVVMWSGRRRAPSTNPLLSTPAVAMEALPAAQSLYYNGAARPWLVTSHPKLLRPADFEPDSERSRSFVQAVESPKLFRQLDRQERFDMLLLVGDPSQYRPLLEHLVQTKDWTLYYLDHTSLMFRRTTAEAWTPAKLDAVRHRMAGLSQREKSTFLAQVAVKLLAIHEMPEAKKALQAAKELDAGNPEVWSGLAHYELQLGQWRAANAAADRALALDAESLPALSAKAQALYASKHFANAIEYSRKIVTMRPNDPSLLFYHAKIAHEARSYGEEIRALDKLIVLADAHQRPTSGYRVYLAQAHASLGEAEPALENFGKALADPDLPAAQRKFAMDTAAQIRSRVRK